MALIFLHHEMTISLRHLTKLHIIMSVKVCITFLHIVIFFAYCQNMLCFNSEKKTICVEVTLLSQQQQLDSEQSQLIEHLFFAPLLFRGL